jgi:hypothetical protein
MKMLSLKTTRPAALGKTIASRFLPFVVTSGLVVAWAAGGPQWVHAKSSPSLPPESYEGMISDTHCGARHSATIGLAAADCTRVCVHGGEQFALVDGDNVYLLEGDLQMLKRMAGERVRIVGVLNGNRISVSSAATSK